MRKLKVYLDTSVISYLDQDDAPERMKDNWNYGKISQMENMTYIFHKSH